MSARLLLAASMLALVSCVDGQSAATVTRLQVVKAMTHDQDDYTVVWDSAGRRAWTRRRDVQVGDALSAYWRLP